MLKVTVLMCVYNGEKYLREAIESILDQTFRDFEFLIIDDGSTDSSRDIILSYNDPRIRLVVNETNIGLTRSLNKGLQLAKGEYIARMDADDISLKHRLQKQIEFMDANQEVGVCGSWMQSLNFLKDFVTHLESHDVIVAHFIIGNSMNHPTTMLRQSFFNKQQLRYDDAFLRSQDYELWARACVFFKFANISDPLVWNRTHSDQVSNIHQTEQRKNAQEVQKRLIRKLNFEPTEMELKLHEYLCYPESDTSPERVKAIGEWLNKIEKQNKKEKIFSTKALRSVLSYRWMVLYRLCSSEGLCPYSSFSQNSFFDTGSLSLREKLKLRVKYFIRYDFQNKKKMLQKMQFFFRTEPSHSASRKRGMRRICIIVNQAYPLFNKQCPANFGGAEVQMYQTANELSNRGDFEVSFIVGDYGQPKKEFYHSIRVIKWYATNHRKIKWVTGIMEYLELFYTLLHVRSDVYITMCASKYVCFIGWFSRFLQKKFIYMSASSIDVDGGYRKENALSGRLYEFGLRHADHVIVQNKQDEKTLYRLYKKRSSVLKNPFVLPEESELSKSHEYILWVGRCVALKQPEAFIRLARKFPQQKFIMIAPKQDEQLWDSIAQDAKDVPNLRIIKSVPFAEIGEYFKKAKVFVNTSTYEGFPNTFVQSAMYGVPILSLNVNPDHFLDEYDCGACAGGSEEKLAKDLEEMLGDEVSWKRRSENARRYAVENHDIVRNVDVLEKIIERVVGKK